MNNILKFSFKKKIIFTIIILLFSYSFINFFSVKVYAIEEIGNLKVTMVPENPQANETVRVRISSFSFDMNKVETSIFINDKLIKREIGIKEFEFQAEDLGQETVVLIIVRINGQVEVVRKISIRPANVDLIYELNNPHRPFMYQGKSVPVSNSAVTVFAFPRIINKGGKTIAKESLVYRWYKNSKLDVRRSGFGKYTYKIDSLGAWPRVTVITLEVSSLDGELVAKESIRFEPEKSKIEFYLIDSSLPFSYRNIANPNIHIEGTEATILAVPYFMNDIESRITEYTWNVGNKEYVHKSGYNRNKILLLNNDGDNFISRVRISLQIKNSFRILQSASKNIFVTFSR